jgi:hypothetical protein
MTNTLHRIGLGITFSLISFYGVYGQHIGIVEGRLPRSWMKAENGQILCWASGVISDRNGDQILIANKQGSKSLGVNVLSLVPDATTVSIWDVAARPGQMVAVSAVYAKAPDVRPEAVLLLFDFKGNLLSALSLAPSRQVEALEIDDDLNIWTLTTHSGEQDPTHIPMVVEYDRNGTVIREALTRNQFPLHAASNQVNPEIGSVASGYDAGTFWFWLPGSADLVLIRASDGRVTRMQTSLPKAPPGQRSIPLRVSRESTGTVIAEVREQGEGVKPHLAYYSWSPDTNAWSPFSPDVCGGHRLIGVDSTEQLYVRMADSDVCVYQRR